MKCRLSAVFSRFRGQGAGSVAVLFVVVDRRLANLVVKVCGALKILRFIIAVG